MKKIKLLKRWQQIAKTVGSIYKTNYYQDSIIKLTAVAFVSLIVAPLIFMAVLNRPVADDIFFLSYNNRGDIVKSAVDMFNVNGRFAQGGGNRVIAYFVRQSFC